MSGEISITPGYIFNEDGELVTLDKLNKLIQDAVARLLAGSVTARELADGSINADKLDTNLNAQLGVQDGSVTTNKLVNLSVTTAKIADQAVTTEKIQDGAVTEDKLSEELADKISREFLLVVDRKTAGSGGEGGAAPSEKTWFSRTLNTVVHNNIVGASLKDNTITLPPGLYMVQASAPAWRVGRHRMRLRDITQDDHLRSPGGVALLSVQGYSPIDFDGTQERSAVTGLFEIEEETEIKVQHWIEHRTTGIFSNLQLGIQSTDGSPRQYTEVFIERIKS